MSSLTAPPSREFATGATEWPADLSRRAFLAASAAGIALATGCSNRPDDEQITPHVVPANDQVAGLPTFYATAFPHRGFARGLLAASREGRPIKLEGNPDHPDSLGATDALTQATLLDLYDPRRPAAPTFGGAPTTLWAFLDALRESLRTSKDGGDVAFLSTARTSPTLARQVRELKQSFPRLRWFTHDPLSRENEYGGHRLAFGQRLAAIHDLATADVILSLDADFLTEGPGALRLARQFADGRRVRAGRMEMSRLYVVESTLSLTGAKADHRLAVRPSEVERLARDVLERPNATGDNPFAAAVAMDLSAHAGRCAVIAGAAQPPATHALAAAINHRLGNVGKTVRYIAPQELEPDGDLADATRAIDAGGVRTLIILGGDPASTAPGDVPFAEALRQLSTLAGSLTAHVALRDTKTGFLSQWKIPEPHYLEAWSDARAEDGTISVMQPLIYPLTVSLSEHDMFEALFGRPGQNAHDAVRATHNLGEQWAESLRRGYIAGTSAAIQPVGVPAFPDIGRRGSSGLEISFQPDASTSDGTYHENAWLQELPRPFTKLVWGTAAWISPRLAAEHKLTDGDVVTLTTVGRSIETPVQIVPGQPDDSVTLSLGSPAAYSLRPYNSPGFTANVALRPTGKRAALVTTSSHHAMTDASQAVVSPRTPELERDVHNRRIVRTATLAELKDNANVIRDLGDRRVPLTLYSAWDYSTGYQWGMSVDMTICTGCNACVVACQAENNIPTVGADQVARGRAMHWIRVDGYFDGDGRVHHQPVMCQHCENAPCEYVCPVGATTHSTEGLNQMTYNRCVGTRYCSNNCPYKVRRFNFLNYTRNLTAEVDKLRQNPEVTVRARGVMEKCTYCVQRIQAARMQVIQRPDEEFAIIDGLAPACAQACPTRAITFGSTVPVAGKPTRVMTEKAQPHDYGLLTELSTKPRTTYLASIINPNPAMEKGGAE